MEWTEVERPDGREWEREDGYAVIRLRQTARGDWAVIFDRLEQAPSGEQYQRVTEESEDAAVARVEAFQQRASGEP
jgi:hypothetical protein